jgi:hypothetical protein
MIVFFTVKKCKIFFYKKMGYFDKRRTIGIFVVVTTKKRLKKLRYVLDWF